MKSCETFIQLFGTPINQSTINSIKQIMIKLSRALYGFSKSNVTYSPLLSSSSSSSVYIDQKAVLKTIAIGNQTLRRISANVKENELNDPQFQSFLKRFKSFFESQQKELGAVGLAAPQVDVSKQILIVELKEAPPYRYKPLARTILLNPKIEIVKGTQSEMIVQWENCLSVPGLFGKVKRQKHIIVSYLDGESGKQKKMQASGAVAGLIQHETDHLNGILYVDRMSKEQLSKYWIHESNFVNYIEETGDLGEINGDWKMLD